MKYKNTSLCVKSLNPTLGFGWFTGIPSLKKAVGENHQSIRTEKENIH